MTKLCRFSHVLVIVGSEKRNAAGSSMKTYVTRRVKRKGNAVPRYVVALSCSLGAVCLRTGHEPRLGPLPDRGDRSISMAEMVTSSL